MLTSPRLYQALMQETFRLNSPKRILLVGAQIPALAIKVIKSLHKEDELFIIDGNSTQIASLKDNLKNESTYHTKSSQIHFENKLLWELDMPNYFNSIVLSYPIDLLSDDILQKSMESCRLLLTEGGTLSCLEMAWTGKV